MGRSYKYNYILQLPVQQNGQRILKEIGFFRWDEKEERIKLMLNGKVLPVKAKFYIRYQTGIGRRKIENELRKIGTLTKIYNIGGGDVPVKRWEIEVEASLTKNGDLKLEFK
ncbi:hypothetical protein ES703_30959 [subsurface metagenome]